MHDNPANIGAVIETDRKPLDVRAKLVAALTETISAATAAGDLHAARVAHEALGRLLAPPSDSDAVVALAASRRRREE